MEQLQAGEQSVLRRSARKRTRCQRQQSLKSSGCRREHEDEGQGNAIDEMNDNGYSISAASLRQSISSSSDVSDIPHSAPGFAFVPCTSDRHVSQYRIRRQTMYALAAAALMLCSPLILACVGASSPSLQYKINNSRSPSALFVSPISRHSLMEHPSMSIQRKTPQQQQSRKAPVGPTWSNAVRQRSDLNESRFGVRKRVKSVLKKAKKRTGVENLSTGRVNGETAYSSMDRVNGGALSFVQSGPNIVAETASLGGLGDGALDYISKGNTQPVKEFNDTSTSGFSIGEKYEDQVSPTPSTSTKVPSGSPVAFRRPEDDFILREKNNDKVNNDTARKTYAEKDAFTGDVSDAFSLPREPLPFDLPTLDPEQSRRVRNGERIQFQDDMGRAGSGFVVWDVKAPASVVWDCLLDFQSYPQTIPTVREVVMYTNTHLKEDYRAEKPLDFEDGTAAICKHGVPSVTRAQFQLSKFRLKIAAVHKYRPHPKGDYMIFTLDPASRNMVLKKAKGIWYTESNPDGKEGHTRVWLLCELSVSRILPQWIVDYAATRAMPRATTWLKPQTEAAAMLWLKDIEK